MQFDLSNLPELSRDGSAFITRTYDKQGRCIAAHATSSGKWRYIRMAPSKLNALQKLESLFSPV
ncbi:hypothetical protein [Candidimonas nitroreducens]|uniref:Uncharacterized protein n=1 Tax=Candidimonas nitroreducens TaxID=683354 RepID=A0A225MKM2_9BURK|nr:hypothetical protein [Candidimonas nitroreducens]OWT61876.1 hypothetical protein CEY11_08570 [Candidimonas nitroreducens]